MIVIRNEVQTSPSFLAELKCLGITIPEDITEVSVNCNAGHPTKIAVAKANLSSDLKKWETFKLVDKATGDELQSKEFFEMVSKVVSMPDSSLATGFKIIAKLDEVVEITIKSAFPVGGLDCLKGYSLKSQTV